ncbi:MAG: hypothetical protein ACHREM_16135 [Polyangiales bacterium]
MRRLLDVVVKDPKKLEELVATHYRSVSDANEAQHSVVVALQAKRKRLTEVRDRFVEAIGIGGGVVKTLVAQIAARETEIEELAARIVEAEALIAPLLLPRPSAVAEYVTGGASVFGGDPARDKRFVEQVLEGITVYADGTITVRFRESSLFAPVRAIDLGSPATGSNGPSVEAVRKLHRDLYENGLAQFDECSKKPTGVRVHEAHGLPVYLFETTQERTLASPTGFEPSGRRASERYSARFCVNPPKDNPRDSARKRRIGGARARSAGRRARDTPALGGSIARVRCAPIA